MKRAAAFGAVLLGLAACGTGSGAVVGAPGNARAAAARSDSSAPPARSSTPPDPAPSSSAGEKLEDVFLGAVRVERGAPGQVGGTRGARLVVFGDLGVLSSELARRRLPATSAAGGTEIVLRGYPARHEPPQPRDRAASFVVDFDTDEVRNVRERAAREAGAHPSVRDLTRFVASYIERKNLARGYDSASVVARRREGDCTEHAVLLTALARSFGFAARVVHGIAIVDVKGTLVALMHAWVEWHRRRVGAGRRGDHGGARCRLSPGPDARRRERRVRPRADGHGAAGARADHGHAAALSRRRNRG